MFMVVLAVRCYFFTFGLTISASFLGATAQYAVVKASENRSL